MLRDLAASGRNLVYRKHCFLIEGTPSHLFLSPVFRNCLGFTDRSDTVLIVDTVLFGGMYRPSWLKKKSTHFVCKEPEAHPSPFLTGEAGRQVTSVPFARQLSRTIAVVSPTPEETSIGLKRAPDSGP
jgi:hypothetical protein